MQDDRNYWKRVDAQRLSRRKTFGLAAGGAALLGAGSLVACGDDDDNKKGGGGSPAARGTLPDGWPQPPVYSKKYPDRTQLMVKYHWHNLPDRKSPQKPKRGGVPIISGAGSPQRGYDPTKNPEPGLVVALALSHNNLLAIDWGAHAKNPLFNNPTTRDGLAESFQQPDDLTYTFKLKPGIKFQNIAPVNGRALTAEDVKYSYEAYQKVAGPYQGNFVDVDRVEVVGTDQIRIVMKQPAAYFLGALLQPVTPIFAREQFESSAGLAEKPIGTGPFTLKNAQPGRQSDWARNPDYFNKGEDGQAVPYIDGAQFRTFGDAATRDAAFRSKQLDYIDPPTFEGFQSIFNENEHVAEVQPNSQQIAHRISFQLKDPRFQDPRVRRAFSLAIDRDSFIDTVWGGSGTARGSVAFMYQGEYWDPAWSAMGPWYKYDPQQAKQLLSAAGYANGLKLELAFPSTLIVAGQSYADTLAATQSDLKQSGIDVELKSMDAVAFQGIWYGKQFKDLASWFIITIAHDPDGWTNEVLKSNAPLNTVSVADPTLDQLIERQRRTIKTEDRQKLIKQIWEREIDQVYHVNLGYNLRFAVWHNYLHDVADNNLFWLNGGATGQLARAWMDDRAPKRTI